MTVTIDSSILLNYMQVRAGLTLTGSGTSAGSTTGTAAAKPQSPTAPWATTSTAPKSSALVKAALSGHKLVDENAAQLDVTGASKDYQKLFALYQGLNTLYGLADKVNQGTIGSFDAKQATAAFNKGLTEVSAYAESLKLDNLRLTRGAALDMTRTQLSSTLAFGKADTDVGVPIENTNYTSAVLHTGALGTPVAAFAGNDVKFQVMVKKVNTTEMVSIDLNDMGTEPRTLSNVVNYLNGKMAEAGAVTRFATNRTPGAPLTVTAGKTTPATPDQWSLVVKGDTSEKISFIAPASASAVYLGQTTGPADDPLTKTVDENKQQSELMKIQTDLSGTADAPPDAVPATGGTYNVDGKVFSKAVGAGVTNIRQTVTGADGSVYVLADVDGTVDTQTIKGSQDVALLKYDSAGNVIYSRTLGAADKASGLALAVSADGQIAVAGSVTGVLDNGDAGADPTKSDSFVTLYDKNGDELWTQRRAARDDDEATSVSFGGDGTVYVAGRAKSTMPGAASVGGWDGYIQSFTGTKQPLGGYKVATNFTSQFGTAGTDGVSGMAVDGNILVTAGVENGRAVLRRFDISSPNAPVLAGTVDLGDLQGGTIAGVSFNAGQVVVAGTTRNGSLAANDVTNALAGGTDAFVATVSNTFGTGATADRLTYFGGAGNDTAAAMTVSGGDVWLTGGAGTDLPNGMAPIGKKDGYVVRLDGATGAIDWSRRFSGKEGYATPSSIAVDSSGASALDRFGLPKGPIQFTQSSLLTSATSVRAGDQFQIRADEGGRAGTVTIEADDTLQTLADKIKRASGFKVKVQIVKDGDVQRLQVKPYSASGTVEILAGKIDKDALKSLGLPEGVVRVTPDAKSKTVDKDKTYGMTLGRDLQLDTKDNIKSAMDQLNTALATIRTAYRDLNTMFNPATASAASKGTAPAYLVAQAANYQAALDRLLGGA